MRQFDLLREFDNIAAELIRAVDRGRVLHGTGNIANSGAPLEHLFRDVVGKRLPEPYRMRTGYLFDAGSSVTPQIDAMIIDAEVSHEIFRQEDGAGYLPYVSAAAVFEIKNSGIGSQKSINQINKISGAIEGMRPTEAGTATDGRRPGTPLSMLVIGTSDHCDLVDLQKTLAKRANGPDFIYFIEKGVLLARESEFFPGERHFRERGNGDWHIYGAPVGKTRRAGWMLLWICFLVLDHLKKLTGDKGLYPEFTQAIERQFPLDDFGNLDAATDWP